MGKAEQCDRNQKSGYGSGEGEGRRAGRSRRALSGCWECFMPLSVE